MEKKRLVKVPWKVGRRRWRGVVLRKWRPRWKRGGGPKPRAELGRKRRACWRVCLADMVVNHVLVHTEARERNSQLSSFTLDEHHHARVRLSARYGPRRHLHRFHLASDTECIG